MADQQEAVTADSPEDGEEVTSMTLLEVLALLNLLAVVIFGVINVMTKK